MGGGAGVYWRCHDDDDDDIRRCPMLIGKVL